MKEEHMLAPAILRNQSGSYIEQNHIPILIEQDTVWSSIGEGRELGTTTIEYHLGVHWPRIVDYGIVRSVLDVWLEPMKNEAAVEQWSIHLPFSPLAQATVEVDYRNDLPVVVTTAVEYRLEDDALAL